VSAPVDAVVVALRRGAPSRRSITRAVGVGALAQLASIALVGGAAALLTWAATKPGLGTIAGLLVAVELVAFLRAPLRHAERLDAHDLGLDGLRGWRTWLLDGVSTWSPSRLAAARSGDLLARCLEDADRLQDLWVRILVPAGAALAGLVAASIVLAILVPVAGATLLVASAIVAGATWLSASRVALLGVAEADVRGQIAARVVEFAHGAEALSLLRADADHLAATAALVHKADALAARRGAIVSSLGVIATMLGAFAFLVAAAAVPLPSHHPALAAGVALAVLACIEPLSAMPAALDPLGEVAGAAARLGELASPLSTGGSPAPAGPLELSQLAVAAADDEPVLISGIELVARAGEPVAVVGPSGSGKSTLLAVAAALEPPRSGAVTLGGTALGDLDEASLRATVAWLPSHPTLLEGRVRDVLDMGRGLDDVALTTALEAVGLAEVLGSRGGLDAVVGQRGADLSGGERRRLALARLLAGRPPVYLLDEPTAGLDDAATSRVLASLRASGAAIVVATHDERVARWASTVRTVAHGSLD